MTKTPNTPVRAEAATKTKDLEGHEYAHLQALHQDGTDGAWYCCHCMKENCIVHYSGDQPFEKLVCGRCKHIICNGCFATDVLNHSRKFPLLVVNLLPVSAAVTRFKGPFGSVCSECGATYRAKGIRSHAFSSKLTHVRFHTDCSCGYSGTNWLRFRIGSNQDWRLARNECYAHAVEYRVERAASIYASQHNGVPEADARAELKRAKTQPDEARRPQPARNALSESVIQRRPLIRSQYASHHSQNLNGLSHLTMRNIRRAQDPPD